MSLTQDEVLRALSVVKDPDLGRDLVTLGMIENVKISSDGDVTFTIVLTTPACPVKEQLKQQSESVVRALPGVRSVAAEVTSRVRTGTMTQREGDSQFVRIALSGKEILPHDRSQRRTTSRSQSDLGLVSLRRSHAPPTLSMTACSGLLSGLTIRYS